MQVFVVMSDSQNGITHEKVRGVFTSREYAEEYAAYLRCDRVYVCVIESQLDRFYTCDGHTFYWHCILCDVFNPVAGRFYADRLSEQYLIMNGIPELNSVICDVSSEQCRVYVSGLSQSEVEIKARKLLMDAVHKLGVPVQLGFNFSYAGKLVG